MNTSHTAETITLSQPSTPEEVHHCLVTPAITNAEAIELQGGLGKAEDYL